MRVIPGVPRGSSRDQKCLLHLAGVAAKLTISRPFFIAPCSFVGKQSISDTDHCGTTNISHVCALYRRVFITCGIAKAAGFNHFTFAGKVPSLDATAAVTDACLQAELEQEAAVLAQTELKMLAKREAEVRRRSTNGSEV